MIFISKLLTSIPAENKHNIDKVNEINKGISSLFEINNDHKILLKTMESSIQVSEIFPDIAESIV